MVKKSLDIEIKKEIKEIKNRRGIRDLQETHDPIEHSELPIRRTFSKMHNCNRKRYREYYGGMMKPNLYNLR